MSEAKRPYTPNGEPLAEADRRWLDNLVAQIGEVAASRLLGLSHTTLYRAIARRPLHRGTRIAIATARREHDRPAV